MEKQNKKTHESYGMIEINKFTGGQQTYFGSSIRHSGGISISIFDAEINRNLYRDRFFHDTIPIIKVSMSHSQFAEMLTANMNTMGTPCTIEYKNGKRMEQPNFESKRLQFEDEFEEKVKDVNKKLNTLIEDTKKILSSKKTPNKSEKEIILDQLAILQQEIYSNIPFIATSFNEQIDKTITEAKADIEGFYEAKIRNLGIEALTNNVKTPEIE